MATGLFFGSFNPIHIGHLAIANWICEFESLDELWFVVSPQNPLKKDNGLLNENIRFKMVADSINGYKKFKACDIELSHPRPSYTANTMRNLVQEYPDRQFVLVMGADNLSILPKWKEYDYLIENYNILVYPRKGINIDIPENLKNIKRVDAPLMEISSTFIRQSIRENKDIRFFMPGNVWKMKDHYL